MDLRTKVLRISLIVGYAVALSLIGYLVYFIVIDTLKPTPKNTVAKNLFIEKDSIDIANIKKAGNLYDCRKLYMETLYSIDEDRLNGFLGDNIQENETQHQILWKRLNYAYIEQFIVLANGYFSHSNWNDNRFVGQCIREIKSSRFVERNTPIWNSLVGFDNSISWYTNTQNCINAIRSVISSADYFSNNNLSALTQRKTSLTNQNCRQNSYKLSELNDVYERLKNRSWSYLFSKIQQYDEDFDNSDKYYYKSTAYQNFFEVKSEVEQWNAVFYTNNELNTQLKNHKAKIDYYYY